MGFMGGGALLYKLKVKSEKPEVMTVKKVIGQLCSITKHSHEGSQDRSQIHLANKYLFHYCKFSPWKKKRNRLTGY